MGLIVEALDTQEKAAHYPTLLPAAKARQSSLERPVDKAQDQAPNPDTSNKAWRELVEKAVEDLIAPDLVSWMSDDKSFSDVQFVDRALEDVKARYIECVEPVYCQDEADQRPSGGRFTTPLRLGARHSRGIWADYLVSSCTAGRPIAARRPTDWRSTASMHTWKSRASCWTGARKTSHRKSAKRFTSP